MAVDDCPIASGLVTHEVAASLIVRSHSESISLGLVSVPFPVILGLDWLRRHNPAIDWVRSQMRFSCCGRTAFAVYDVCRTRPLLCRASDRPSSRKTRSPLMTDALRSQTA